MFKVLEVGRFLSAWYEQKIKNEAKNSLKGEQEETKDGDEIQHK